MIKSLITKQKVDRDTLKRWSSFSTFYQGTYLTRRTYTLVDKSRLMQVLLTVIRGH